ncbi:hypothetical protein OGAPHI_005130 [Ogataea philodendri]|uniref:Peptidyl-prolyl cis-trans isomerase n=1 Tax=Ogataea philodendri TaxID=1378263 RepID=A0A9P8P0S0_9ASCO|nr:uncharacterized protein OGAPHI_005130 [Ogataea philodendri]KAH3663728.1 hypothetical protein OGAPHI_005130 [Ogataea philodendri]
MSVLLETTAGNLVIDLDTDSRPKECRLFLALCKRKYYHYSPFVNVVKNQSVDCGNPHFPEPVDVAHLDTYAEYTPPFTPVQSLSGTVGQIGQIMFAVRDQTPGPEFKVLLGPASRLQSPVFGSVAEGFTTLEYINECILDIHLRPLKDVRILHTYILHDPFDLPVSSPASPLPTQTQIDSFRLLLDEDALQDIKAESNALTLEVLGDLPSAKIQPSDKVLFITKLNPITKEEDLRLIFQRFGTISSVEIIKDKVTGHSLCYGFIEFTDKKAVELAYRKMEGARIDDRRVHVDFSQSTKRKRQRPF